MLNDDPQQFLIRGYRASDRETVRKLCCNTGFLGEPIDPVYEDRELFADFLTTYYTDHEPESCFLLEVDGEISGYLLGSRKPLQNQLYALYQNVWLFFRALTRYFRYNQRSRRFIRWLLMYGWHEVPARPRRVPHFHIHLLPEARKVSTTRAHANSQNLEQAKRLSTTSIGQFARGVGNHNCVLVAWARNGRYVNHGARGVPPIAIVAALIMS